LNDIAKKSGRKLILWNDQLDVSKDVELPKDCIVQFWRIAAPKRGPREGCTFAKLLEKGYKVICSPFEFAYIDEEPYANPEKIATYDYKTYANDGSNADVICGAEVCAWEYGNPKFDFYPRSFAPSAILLLAKMWDKNNLVYDKAFRAQFNKLILGHYIPQDYDMSELFGDLMPPRKPGQISYASLENGKITLDILEKHKKVLSNITSTYSPIYLKALLSLVEELKVK
jgi:hypothetical protein